MSAITHRLREARVAKSWSQRDLSEHAGIPQAHISRIESGAVDPKVSTLQDLARALDLELMLAPRAALNAVDALVRETTREDDRRLLRDIAKRMHDAATTLQAKAGGLSERVADAADDLSKLDPSEAPPWVRKDVLAAALAVDEAVKAHSAQRLEPATAALQKLLIEALAGRGETRPAYALDDEA
jgi:transcriptional regulator with XRE-family HTH domain